MPEDRWIEITARVDPADVEVVAGALSEVSLQGVVIEPAILPSDDVDFAFEELDEPTRIRAFAPDPFPASQRRQLRRRLNDLPLTSPLPRLRYRALVPLNWAEEWKQFFDIQHVGQRIVIRPTWIEYAPAPDELMIDLDPGVAFGTGQHETTRLCLIAIERWLEPGHRVLDVGCGSGILSIGAVKLGASDVLALDVDPDAIAVTEENATANDVSPLVRATVGSLDPDWPNELGSATECADLVVANISSRAVLALLPAIARALRPNGVAILSGFLTRDTLEIERATESADLELLEATAEGQWACLAARRPTA